MVFVALGLVGLSGAVVSADTLVLRNGDRISGRLVAVRNGVVEFEQERGGQRVMRVDQDEVRAIEFDRGFRLEPLGGDNGRPRGMREREVNVSARTPWNDTGISLRAGQTIYFQATGRVRWGPRRQDGPAGESESPRNSSRPIPSRPGAALIGRIGDDAPFFIGDDMNAIRVRSGGQLLLGINDDVFEDNSGEFRVSVYF
jgi:hypothetical protein